MRRRLYKKDHPNIASSLKLIGDTYGYKKDYSNELNNKLESFAMYKRLFRTDHALMVEVLESISIAYGHLGDKINENKFKKESTEMNERLKNMNKF